jgi:sugar phosphate isomerase/epimerase
MKLSCLPVSFFNELITHEMSVLDWAKIGIELDLDAVDISILFIQDLSIDEIKKLRLQLEDLGKKVLMVTTYPDFTHPNPAQRSKELEMEVQAVERAVALGASYVRVTAGQAHPETKIEEGMQWAIDLLIKLAQKTRDLPIRLVYENHAKPGAWDYTDFSQPPAIFLKIARAIRASGIKINFDTGNAAAFSDDPLGLLSEIIQDVETIHASDTSTRGALNHTLLGTGFAPFPQFFALLKQAGWDGWICMEEASNMNKEGVRKAAAYIRQTWDSIP